MGDTGGFSIQTHVCAEVWLCPPLITDPAPPRPSVSSAVSLSDAAKGLNIKVQLLELLCVQRVGGSELQPCLSGSHADEHASDHRLVHQGSRLPLAMGRLPPACLPAHARFKPFNSTQTHGGLWFAAPPVIPKGLQSLFF